MNKLGQASGQNAIYLIDADPDRIAVPENTVLTVDGQTVVFIRTQEGFKLQPVQIGDRSAGMVTILSGLEAGQSIASDNAGRFSVTLHELAEPMQQCATISRRERFDRALDAIARGFLRALRALLAFLLLAAFAPLFFVIPAPLLFLLILYFLSMNTILPVHMQHSLNSATWWIATDHRLWAPLKKYNVTDEEYQHALEILANRG